MEHETQKTQEAANAVNIIKTLDVENRDWKKYPNTEKGWLDFWNRFKGPIPPITPSMIQIAKTANQKNN